MPPPPDLPRSHNQPTMFSNITSHSKPLGRFSSELFANRAIILGFMFRMMASHTTMAQAASPSMERNLMMSVAYGSDSLYVENAEPITNGPQFFIRVAKTEWLVGKVKESKNSEEGMEHVGPGNGKTSRCEFQLPVGYLRDAPLKASKMATG
ncbi:Peptidyl-prolyl cis-trans isomerase A [Galemys pyrenaicus]|uniref:Peptidyl-prolyl cis-trans isomerase A n=1 Tax=Galemys pyrenaicus TaxID=202257 RepID=A0A8J6A4R4_GALPY|nr:Peptidyl-prolyl cis-trans isomerase A [Galemys pyrenaicus]